MRHSILQPHFTPDSLPQRCHRRRRRGKNKPGHGLHDPGGYKGEYEFRAVDYFRSGGLFRGINLVVAGVETLDNFLGDIESRVEIHACGLEENSVVALGSVVDLDIVLD